MHYKLLQEQAAKEAAAAAAKAALEASYKNCPEGLQAAQELAAAAAAAVAKSRKVIFLTSWRQIHDSVVLDYIASIPYLFYHLNN